MKLRIHSVLSGGAVDGPGLRTVIFTQGCPLKCKYCHNRDTWSASGGREEEVSELVALCLGNKKYYGKRGGVTVSGGEPLLQVPALIELCKHLKSNGLHVCLDTAGSIVNDKVEELLQYVDLVLLDIKHSTADGFKELAGGSLETTLRFLDLLRKTNTKFWIRQVLVDGYTANKTQLDGLLNLLGYNKKLLGTLNYFPEKVELLPYHGRGESKWEKVGAEYPLKGMPDLNLTKYDALNTYVQTKINDMKAERV